ncbi:MAG: MBL fold metallo-hydrolase [Chlamydiae bacterium]|nr:MBL fold metallo-hydrolase [Chlamydiota bacterium]
MMLRVFPCGPIQTNVYLLYCDKTKKAWLVDAPKDSFDCVKQEVDRLGLTVEKIFLTHSHWDHIADLSLFKKYYMCPVLVHHEDATNVERPGSDNLPLYFNIDGLKPDQLLQGGEVFVLSDISVEIFHTPGHSPGGICLYFPAEGVLISGDTLFKGSLGRIDLATSEPERMWDSLAHLSRLPLDTKVYPGHGDATTIREESWLKNAKHLFS